MINTKALILLVDDNEDDRLLMLRSLKKSDPGAEVVSIASGGEALDYLNDLDDSPHPTVLLLDLNMPKVDGFEVLENIRANPETHSLPVVILTTSNEEEDVRRAYELGANSFVRKPVDSSEFADVVSQLKSYWLKTNLPRKGG